MDNPDRRIASPRGDSRSTEFSRYIQDEDDQRCSHCGIRPHGGIEAPLVKKGKKGKKGKR